APSAASTPVTSRPTSRRTPRTSRRRRRPRSGRSGASAPRHRPPEGRGPPAGRLPPGRIGIHVLHNLFQFGFAGFAGLCVLGALLRRAHRGSFLTAAICAGSAAIAAHYDVFWALAVFGLGSVWRSEERR